MWLLNVLTRELENFSDNDLSSRNYAILSHTWGNEEVTFDDIEWPAARGKEGYRKIDFACRQAWKDCIAYVWIDTCCIDKRSSAELSAAINSMFDWYYRAKICYVYLADVNWVQTASYVMDPQWRLKSHLTNSRWFTRGWTLQELIAPKSVQFFDRQWNVIGFKAKISQVLSDITKIPTTVLNDRAHLMRTSIAQRMSWAAVRVTTRLEDQAYCLLGIFQVNMPLLYGEGAKAFVRLQEEVVRSGTWNNRDHSILLWSSANLDPSDSRCLLAPSPAAFLDAHTVLHWALPPDDTFEMLSKGLRMSVYAKPGRRAAQDSNDVLHTGKTSERHPDSDLLIALNCRDKSSGHFSYALRLRRRPRVLAIGHHRKDYDSSTEHIYDRLPGTEVLEAMDTREFTPMEVTIAHKPLAWPATSSKVSISDFSATSLSACYHDTLAWTNYQHAVLSLPGTSDGIAHGGIIVARSVLQTAWPDLLLAVALQNEGSPPKFWLKGFPGDHPGHYDHLRHSIVSPIEVESTTRNELHEGEERIITISDEFVLSVTARFDIDRGDLLWALEISGPFPTESRLLPEACHPQQSREHDLSLDQDTSADLPEVCVPDGTDLRHIISPTSKIWGWLDVMPTLRSLSRSWPQHFLFGRKLNAYHDLCSDLLLAVATYISVSVLWAMYAKTTIMACVQDLSLRAMALYRTCCRWKRAESCRLSEHRRRCGLKAYISAMCMSYSWLHSWKSRYGYHAAELPTSCEIFEIDAADSRRNSVKTMHLIMRHELDGKPINRADPGMRHELDGKPIVDAAAIMDHGLASPAILAQADLFQLHGVPATAALNHTPSISRCESPAQPTMFANLSDYAGLLDLVTDAPWIGIDARRTVTTDHSARDPETKTQVHSAADEVHFNTVPAGDDEAREHSQDPRLPGRESDDGSSVLLTASSPYVELSMIPKPLAVADSVKKDTKSWQCNKKKPAAVTVQWPNDYEPIEASDTRTQEFLEFYRNYGCYRKALFELERHMNISCGAEDELETSIEEHLRQVKVISAPPSEAETTIDQISGAPAEEANNFTQPPERRQFGKKPFIHPRFSKGRRCSRRTNQTDCAQNDAITATVTLPETMPAHTAAEPPGVRTQDSGYASGSDMQQDQQASWCETSPSYARSWSQHGFDENTLRPRPLQTKGSRQGNEKNTPAVSTLVDLSEVLAMADAIFASA